MSAKRGLTICFEPDRRPAPPGWLFVTVVAPFHGLAVGVKSAGVARLHSGTAGRSCASSGGGLDHYQVHGYRAWYRHITLSMAAAAFLVIVRDSAKKGTHYQ
jgi:hypothetical protein